jgi:hypothetical protein
VEDRSRTYQPRQNGYSTITKPRIRVRVKGRYTNPLVPLFDDQLDRPPVRIPETEAEIEQVIQWLKSQGYLRPAMPAPPSVPPPQPVVMPGAAKPAQNAPRSGTGLWLLLGMLPMGIA